VSRQDEGQKAAVTPLFARAVVDGAKASAWHNEGFAIPLISLGFLSRRYNE